MKPMNRLKCAAIPLCALGLAPLACLAQGSPLTYEVLTETVKPGMTAKVEQGIKAVDDYAQSHGDPVGSEAFQVVTGPNMGQLIILSAFNWATADQTPSYEAGLLRVVNQRVSPYLANLELQLTDVLPQLGNPPAAGSTPMKYYRIERLVIKPDHMSAFLTAVASISAAERKENPPGTGPVIIYQMRSGGNPNEIIIAFGHPSLADFVKTNADGMSVLEALTKARGADAATVISRSADAAIASEQTYIVEYRPDLSYTPGGQGQ